MRAADLLRPGAAILRARERSGAAIGWVLDQYDAHSRLKYEGLQPEFLFCDVAKLPAEGVLWRGAWNWAIYEIESMDMAQSLAERGAQYIETMAVREMSAALRSAGTEGSSPASHE